MRAQRWKSAPARASLPSNRRSSPRSPYHAAVSGARCNAEVEIRGRGANSSSCARARARPANASASVGVEVRAARVNRGDLLLRIRRGERKLAPGRRPVRPARDCAVERFRGARLRRRREQRDAAFVVAIGGLPVVGAPARHGNEDKNDRPANIHPRCAAPLRPSTGRCRPRRRPRGRRRRARSFAACLVRVMSRVSRDGSVPSAASNHTASRRKIAGPRWALRGVEADGPPRRSARRCRDRRRGRAQRRRGHRPSRANVHDHRTARSASTCTPSPAMSPPHRRGVRARQLGIVVRSRGRSPRQIRSRLEVNDKERWGPARRSSSHCKPRAATLRVTRGRSNAPAASTAAEPATTNCRARRASAR